LLDYRSMRKSLVAIIAVAIIGALGVYAKSSGSDAAKTSHQPAVQSAAAMASSGTAAQNSSAATDNSSFSATSSGQYKDGTYTGTSQSNVYGDVQVQAVVSGGKITDVVFLRMPSDAGHSREVTAFSEPVLKQETLQKQSAHIDFVSGATQTSESYERSLQAALDRAA
jgi:uncharacterized protein with FMN-binding domain